MYRIFLKIKNKEEIVPEKQTLITDADVLKNMGTILLKINIQGIEYEIKTYAVLKGLICGFLLGNNFCLKYGLVIDFGKRK